MVDVVPKIDTPAASDYSSIPPHVLEYVRIMEEETYLASIKSQAVPSSFFSIKHNCRRHVEDVEVLDVEALDDLPSIEAFGEGCRDDAILWPPNEQKYPF